ncbi:Erv29 protein [Martiniozyma asiatica (nom. inval.)]|nr:Erv29 protein [Martiniozyma asiatica]
MSFRGSEFPHARGNFQQQPMGQQHAYEGNFNNDSAFARPAPSASAGTSRSVLDVVNSMIPSDNEHVKKFERASDQLDEYLDKYLGFFKPYVPAIGRFLIVATFLEDSLRIISQWKQQVYYLATYRHLYEWIVKLFLTFNIIGMILGSVLVIFRKQPLIATGVLSSIVMLQGLVYGLFFEFSFFLRNVSVIGGLFLGLSDSLVIDKRALGMAGLPMLETKDFNKKYFLLAGRIMLIVLFVTFMITIKWSFISILIILIGLIACLSVAIGYKTKMAASILTTLLIIHNCWTNHYWTYNSTDSRRDYLRYEFFQTLSIVGGLLLIVNTGAGELSIDEKKKKF